MFGLDNNILMGLVGVVLVFCLLTKKKSFKSLMKKDMLVIIGLTLLLVCCMAKNGRIIEGLPPNFNINEFYDFYGSQVSPDECTGHDNFPFISCNGEMWVFRNTSTPELCSKLDTAKFFFPRMLGLEGVSEAFLTDLDSFYREKNCHLRDPMDDLKASGLTRGQAIAAAVGGQKGIGDQIDMTNLKASGLTREQAIAAAVGGQQGIRDQINDIKRFSSASATSVLAGEAGGLCLPVQQGAYDRCVADCSNCDMDVMQMVLSNCTLRGGSGDSAYQSLVDACH